MEDNKERIPETDGKLRGVAPLPVYRQHLGADFDRLPPAVRRFHALQGHFRLSGTVAIRGAETALGRLLAIAMRFPSEAPSQPFAFELDATPEREVWTRFFPSRTMRSRLSARGEWLTEAFGPIRLFFKVEAAPERLSMRLDRMALLGVRMPKALTPGVRAAERDADGKFDFDIEASWPGDRRIVAYTGTIDAPEARGPEALTESVGPSQTEAAARETKEIVQ
jgi:hypothetical protein